MSKKKDFIAVLCGSAVATFTFLVFFELALMVKSAKADLGPNSFTGATYSASAVVPSTAPYYVGPSSNTIDGIIPGGAAATNAVPANVTNGLVWSTPADIRRLKSFAIEILANQVSNTTASIGKYTNYVFLYASGSEGRVNTNNIAITLGPFYPQTGSTNLYDITNIPPGIFDNVGFVFAGVGNQGTNSETNLIVRVVSKAGTFD